MEIKEGGCKMIRDHVKEMADKLGALGKTLADDVPNKDQVTEIVTDVFGIVTEGTDFAGIPQGERAKAIAHAFIKAAGEIADGAISYSDDPTA